MRSSSLLLLALVGALACACSASIELTTLEGVISSSVESATRFHGDSFGLFVESRSGNERVDTACLADKVIAECEGCPVVGKWENTTVQIHYLSNETKEAQATSTIKYTFTFSHENVLSETVDVTTVLNDFMMDYLRAYMTQYCPSVPKPKDNVVLKLTVDAKVAYFSPHDCFIDIGEQKSCQNECTADIPVFLRDPCNPGAPQNLTEAVCSMDVPDAAKVSLSDECHVMVLHDLTATDESGDITLRRVHSDDQEEPPPDFLLIGVFLVLLVVAGVVAFFLWKKFKSRSEESHGDDGLYEMGRDFDDDF